MGSCNFKADSADSTTQLSRSQFHFHYSIGKGGFSKVWKVELKSTRQPFAMKEMAKARILAKKSVNSVLNERKLLSCLKHPLIVNMQFAFQDRESLYLVLDLMPGGDLRYHIGRQKRFSEEQTKFFVACILLALECLHDNGILHRDIKPENLVLDKEGYVHLTDFGIARLWHSDNARDTSGTPGYMAPEVMCRQNHTYTVDYFAVGVIVYELMNHRRPYVGKSRKDIRDQILSKQAHLKLCDAPQGWSAEAVDFANLMIQRKPMNRLGNNGPAEAKNHPWLRHVPWQGILDKGVQAPFVPQGDGNFDVRHQLGQDVWKDANSEALLQGAEMLRKESTQALFAEYLYEPNERNRTENISTNMV